MLITEKSISSFAIPLAITVFGMFSQQPAILGTGMGLAGGIGATNLVRSRRKNVESAAMVQLKDMNRRLQTLEKGKNTGIVRESHQNAQIARLTNDAIATKENLDRLNHQVQINTTQYNLVLGGLRKAQTENHRHRAIIAAQEQEIANKEAKIDRLNYLVSSSAQNNAIPARPTTHVLIDGTALYYVVQDLGLINYQALLAKFTEGAADVNAKFYLADLNTDGQKRFISYLEKIGFEVILFPIIDIGGGEYKVKGDDVQISIDAVNVASGDRVILCCGGDSDYFPVVNRLTEMEIDFTVVAYLKNTGAALKEAAGDRLVDLAAVRAECAACRN
jgi:type II secretory pathway pseudopilin PulG